MPRVIAQPDPVDVLIIGAGLAGLRIATSLRAQGRTVQVLEAAPQVGGRSRTVDVEGVRLDLGGQWVGADHRLLRALVEELGLDLFPTWHRGRRQLWLGGKLRAYRGEIPTWSPVALLGLHRLMQRVDALAEQAQDPIVRAQTAGMSVLQWGRQQRLQPRALSMLQLVTASVLSSDADEVGALYLLDYVRAAGGIEALIRTEGGAQQFRIRQGAQSLALRLAAQIPDAVRCDAAVRRVELRADHVAVQTDQGWFQGRRLVLAVPPAAWQRIAFDPVLPPARQRLAQRSFMGSTIKVVAFYDDAFWRTAGWSGESVADDDLFTFTFDNTFPPQGHRPERPALVGFVTGRRALDASQWPQERLRTQCIAAFGRRFGDAARHAVALHAHDWSREPWTQGCPVSLLPPGWGWPTASSWSRPWGPVHFAGTETAERWGGFFEGALESAARVLEELR